MSTSVSLICRYRAFKRSAGLWRSLNRHQPKKSPSNSLPLLTSLAHVLDKSALYGSSGLLCDELLVNSLKRWSVVQDRQVELAEARGVGDHVDLDDLAACDREIEDEEQPTMPGHDESYGSVHESRSRSLGTS